MKDKILSVSIAAYNAENYLDKVTSILNISCRVQESLEMIIVNDGSKDNTMKKALEIQKKWPESIVIIDKKNGGYGSTINESIRRATGKYFKVLDSDDWFDSTNIENFIDFLDKVNDDLIISPYYRVYEESGSMELINRHPSSGKYNIPLHMHEICVKTKAYKNLKFIIDEHCFYTDTEYAIACMAISNKMVKFDEAIYCYRIGREGQSVSIESRIKNINDSYTVVKRCLSILNSLDNQAPNINVLKLAVIDMVNFHYLTLSFLDDESCKYKIKEFDRFIKIENSEVYQGVIKKIKLLRMIRFSNTKLIKIILN